MVIEVNKDIDRYQESVAMGLTARQLIFSIASRSEAPRLNCPPGSSRSP